MYVAERLIRSILEREISIADRVYSANESLVRFFLEKVAFLATIFIDIFVPDRLLLIFMNALNRRLRPQTINMLVIKIEILVSPRVRSSLIDVADHCVLDAAASSRKTSTMLAFIGKYIPDSIIPPESAESWSNLKLKLHVPTLISRNLDSSIRQN